MNDIKCPACGGRKRPLFFRKPCSACKGTGKVRGHQPEEVVKTRDGGVVPEGFRFGVAGIRTASLEVQPQSDRPGEQWVENPKTGAGRKKPQMNLVPPRAMVLEAKVFELGAAKYTPYNFRESRVPASIYYAAALRHLMAWFDGEDNDEESGLLHTAHVRACMAILIDAEAQGTLDDDRPTTGTTAQLLKELIQEDAA